MNSNGLPVPIIEQRSQEKGRTTWLTRSENDSSSDAERRRLRGLPQNRLELGAFAPVSHLRSRRLLRFLSATARQETFPRKSPPDCPVLRAGRELALVLRPRGAGLRVMVKPSLLIGYPAPRCGTMEPDLTPQLGTKGYWNMAINGLKVAILIEDGFEQVEMVEAPQALDLAILPG